MLLEEEASGSSPSFPASSLVVGSPVSSSAAALKPRTARDASRSESTKEDGSVARTNVTDTEVTSRTTRESWAFHGRIECHPDGVSAVSDDELDMMVVRNKDVCDRTFEIHFNGLSTTRYFTANKPGVPVKEISDGSETCFRRSDVEKDVPHCSETSDICLYFESHRRDDDKEKSLPDRQEGRVTMVQTLQK